MPSAKDRDGGRDAGADPPADGHGPCGDARAAWAPRSMSMVSAPGSMPFSARGGAVRAAPSDPDFLRQGPDQAIRAVDKNRVSWGWRLGGGGCKACHDMLCLFDWHVDSHSDRGGEGLLYRV